MLITLALIVTPGCATIVNGRTEVIGIDSLPRGATARIQPGDQMLVTPGQVVLNRKSSYAVRVEKEGYEPASVALVSSASSSMWRNLVWIHPVGWLIGLIVDISTGAGYDLQPDKVEVTLIPKAP